MPAAFGNRDESFAPDGISGRVSDDRRITRSAHESMKYKALRLVTRDLCVIGADAVDILIRALYHGILNASYCVSPDEPTRVSFGSPRPENSFGSRLFHSTFPKTLP